MSDCSRWQGDFEPANGDPEVRTYHADLSVLPELIRFVVEQGQCALLFADDCARLAIVIEELFINSVTHGYGQRADSPLLAVQAGDHPGEAEVRLAISSTGNGAVTIDYQDRGMAFNPLIDGPALPESDERATGYLTERVGGVGLWLLRNYARAPRYDRVREVNRLRFSLGGNTDGGTGHEL